MASNSITGLTLPLRQPEATYGYRLNHFMLRIRDPIATLNFYVNLMGMQPVFIRNIGPITIHYLGYPQTPTHIADSAAYAQETQDHSVLTSTLGLLELCHFHGSEHRPEGELCTGSRPPDLGFDHLGFTVPDVSATVERLRKAGVKIVKDLNAGVTDRIPVTRWEKDQGIATAALSPKFLKILDQIAMVEDPNGYMIELVPQTLEH